MINKIQWSLESLRALLDMESFRFASDETSEYRAKLMREIERKILLIGTSLPSKENEYQETNRIMVDRYKIYYSVNNDGTIAYIESVKHERMQ